VIRPQRYPSRWRTPEGMEYLGKITAATAFSAGAVTTLLGYIQFGTWVKVLGFALVSMGAAASVITVGLTLAVGRAQARKERLAADHALKERLLAPIATVCAVDPYSIGVDIEQVQIQLQPGHDDRYLQRDCDEDLRRVLDETLADGKPRLIMLEGPPKAGKSRTLFEAVLRHPKLKTATLIAPTRKAGVLSWVLEPGHMPSLQPDPVLLWLDDLEYFVHPGSKGMNQGVLRSLEQWEQQVIVLATAGGKGSERLTSNKLSTPFNELLRSGGYRLSLAGGLSEDEFTRARASYVMDQAKKMKKYGIGEYLAAAPELEHKLATERHPGDPEACPEGAAVVWAAADWARAGMLRPVPEETLCGLWRNYSGSTPATKERFQDGLTWAQRIIYRSSSLLNKLDDGYQPYESIVAYANRKRNIDPATWDSIIKLASFEEAFQLGVAAYNIQNFDRAERAMQKAGDANDPEIASPALFNLGLLAEERSDLQGGEVAYRRADERGHPGAAFSLGTMLEERGDLQGAEAAYRRADERGHLGAALRLGAMLEERGDLQGAEAADRSEMNRTFSGNPADFFDGSPAWLTDAEGDLPGARDLDAFITTNGDNQAYDDEVRGRVAETSLLVLGLPVFKSRTAQFLHCTVPVVGSTIDMLPVFTRGEYVQAAVQMNPAWASLYVLKVSGAVVMTDLADKEWLGINPWSGHEFKLPPNALAPPTKHPPSTQAVPHTVWFMGPRRPVLRSEAFEKKLKRSPTDPSV
jgi:tetratricopeptide (TPR) repeat protein